MYNVERGKPVPSADVLDLVIPTRPVRIVVASPTNFTAARLLCAVNKRLTRYDHTVYEFARFRQREGFADQPPIYAVELDERLDGRPIGS